MSTAHKSLDGHTRKRFYLFRHGEVDYTPQGKVVKNPDLVDLTEVGKKQAKSIDENTKEFSIERIICSGLPRTLQTAEHIASRREITIECFPLLKEYEFYRRITCQLETIIKEDWSEMAAFLHGAVNAAIMCWVNDVDISFASKYDQDHAALNIIDIDVNKKGEIVRKILKRYNIPPNLSTIDSDMRSSWENTASKIANLK